MNIQNRRDFIKTSTAISFFFVSKALAAPAPPRKIGLVHSTALNAEFEACFLAGLKSGGWESKPAA